MTRNLGRPVPELQSAQIHHDGRELSWLVVCTIRAPLLALSTPEIIYEAMESSLEDGILRVMQLAIAKLASTFCSKFEGTPYRYYGKRDEEDRPVSNSEDFVFARHFQHMEGQLYNTQITLDRLRQEFNFRGREIDRLEGDQRVSEATKRRLVAQRNTHKFADFHLRAQVRDLQFQLAASQARVKELEEEPCTSSNT